MRLVIFFVMSLVLVLGMPAIIEAISLPSDYNNHQLSKLKNTNQDFCFAVIGDPHFGETKSQPYILKYQIENASTDNDFIIVNGDLTHHGDVTEFDDYFNTIKDSKIPIISVNGNHDIRMNSNLFSDIFGDNYFNFKYNGYNFIILDSATYIIGIDQYNWLSAQLDTLPAILITHTPIYGAPDRPYKDFYDFKIVSKLIERKSPMIIIASHHHQIRKFTQDNVRYIITGSAGGEPKASYETICLPAK